MNLVAQLAVPSLKYLLAIEDERTRQLNVIQRTVQAHIEGPYQSALIYLTKANSSTVTSEQRADNLRLAEQRFIDALGNFTGVEPLQRSWAGIHLAGICMLGNRVGEAREWATQAHADAVAAISTECKAVTDRMEGTISPRLKGTRVASVAGFGALVLLATPIGLAVGAGVASSIWGYGRYVSQRSRARLEELGVFVDQIGDLVHSLGGDVPRYVLSIDGDGFATFSNASVTS